MTIRDFDFKAGALILIRNTAIEKSLNCKMRPCYLGPLVVVSRNKGGAYIVCELDGALYHHPVAAYRVIPYFARNHVELPNFEKYSDISVQHLRNMENSMTEDPEDLAEQQEADVDNDAADENEWSDQGDDLEPNGGDLEIFD